MLSRKNLNLNIDKEIFIMKKAYSELKSEPARKARRQAWTKALDDAGVKNVLVAIESPVIFKEYTNKTGRKGTRAAVLVKIISDEIPEMQGKAVWINRFFKKGINAKQEAQLSGFKKGELAHVEIFNDNHTAFKVMFHQARAKKPATVEA